MIDEELAPGLLGTTTHGLPYPPATDPVSQGAAAIQALAEAVDARVFVPIYDSGNLAAPAAALDTGTLVVPPGIKSCRVIARMRGSAAGDQTCYVRLNNDANVVYDFAYIGRDGSSVQQAYQLATNAWALSGAYTDSAVAVGKAGALDFTILDAFTAGVAKSAMGMNTRPRPTADGGVWSWFGNYYPAGLPAITRIGLLPGGAQAGIGSRLIVLGMP